MKIIITENQYLRLLENQLDLFDGEEEEFQISDESDEEDIPKITYANAKHKPEIGFVFFSDVNGDLPSEGKIKLLNVRKPKSKGEREDDIIIDVNKFTKSDFGYKISDEHPEVRGIKSFDDTTPKVTSTVGPRTIKLKFMNVVFKCIQNIYGKTTNWATDGNRGPKGRGGVINIYTINKILKDANVIQSNFPGGEWSILNYFDTNPKVRNYLMNKYKKETGISINTMNDLNGWCKWIEDNQKNFFTNGVVLNDLIKLNSTSYLSGYHNESTVYNYLSNIISNNSDLILDDPKKPGASSDRKGVDFTIINTNTAVMNDFQAKPLNSYNIENGQYIVTSYNVADLENKNVQYFIFSSRNTNDNDILIFEKREGEIKSNDTTVVFNYPPISPEELLKEL